MIQWYQMLPWHLALMLVLLVLIVIGAVWVGIHELLRVREPQPKPTWRAVDYSAKRARALEQLGTDYLLARSINR